MKYQPINGWTKARIIEAIQTKMLDHPSTYGNSCEYLAEDGNRCAVGVFIPDKHKGQTYFGFVHDLLQTFPDLKEVVPLDLAALQTLQTIHDMAADVDRSDRRPKLIAWIEENVEDAA